MNKILLSHPNGNANVRGVLNGLKVHDMLQSFHTSVACFSGTYMDTLANLPLLHDFRRRTYASDVRKLTHTYPFNELGRMVAQKVKLKTFLTHETGIFCTHKCTKYIDHKVASYISKHNDITAVYAYEDGALETFRAAKLYGIKCIYDLPIGYWQAMHRMLSEEREKNPEWTITLGGFNDSEEKLQRKDEELSLSDIIFVASSFTKETLKEYPGKLPEIKVIPYGFPNTNAERKYMSFSNIKKIKLLYVGGLSQRKGISYLFEAIKGLEQYCELTVVGSGNINSCPVLKKELNMHKYIPSLPHSEILKLMSEHDVLIFPSLFEGFGLVVTEAMSQGTPVITTERTCGPDIIVNGENGWLVDAGSCIALRQRIEEIITHPELIKMAGQAAMETAKSRPWNIYGEETIRAIKELLK